MPVLTGTNERVDGSVSPGILVSQIHVKNIKPPFDFAKAVAACLGPTPRYCKEQFNQNLQWVFSAAACKIQTEVAFVTRTKWQRTLRVTILLLLLSSFSCCLSGTQLKRHNYGRWGFLLLLRSTMLVIVSICFCCQRASNSAVKTTTDTPHRHSKPLPINTGISATNLYTDWHHA